MKIALITGARGFIGRHLSLSLHQQGIRVCGVGHGAWTESERAAWGVSYWLNGEVTKRNLDIVQSNLTTPQVVFHLAGGSSVGHSLLVPEEDFRRSVISSAELLEWARLSAPDVRLVLASSAAVYGAGHSRAIRETDAMAPYSPYGYHKRIAEELFESYGANFGLDVSIVRLFSVYGSELRKQLLWDVCCRLARDSSVMKLGGSGDEVRDWVHVSDVVKLLQMPVQSRDGRSILNGGYGVAVTVRQVAEHLCSEWGLNTELEFSGESRTGDPRYLVADIARARALGFSPRTDWKTGICNYVKWFKLATSRVSD